MKYYLFRETDRTDPKARVVCFSADDDHSPASFSLYSGKNDFSSTNGELVLLLQGTGAELTRVSFNPDDVTVLETDLVQIMYDAKYSLAHWTQRIWDQQEDKSMTLLDSSRYSFRKPCESGLFIKPLEE